MIDSAPISTAFFTFSTSTSKSLQSREVPRFTLIFVFNMDPMPLGSMQVWFLLQGIAICPLATYARTSSGVIRSFFATSSISFEIMPCLAASICVV